MTAVVDRHVFYNESSFDGGDAAIGPADDGAIAPDKTPYVPQLQIAVHRLTDNDTFDGYPQVSGPNVIWQGVGGSDGGTDAEIFSYDGNTVTQLTENADSDRDPQISSWGAAWDRGSGDAQEIIFYDGQNEIPLTDNSVFDGNVSLGDCA